MACDGEPRGGLPAKIQVLKIGKNRGRNNDAEEAGKNKNLLDSIEAVAYVLYVHTQQGLDKHGFGLKASILLPPPSRFPLRSADKRRGSNFVPFNTVKVGASPQKKGKNDNRQLSASWRQLEEVRDSVKVEQQHPSSLKRTRVVFLKRVAFKQSCLRGLSRFTCIRRPLLCEALSSISVSWPAALPGRDRETPGIFT